MTGLRCITLYPEHAEAFRLRIRWAETRGRATKHRGRIGLHAGMRDPDSAAARRDLISRAALDAIPHGDPLTRGAIVATAELVDCVPMVHTTQPRDGHCLVVSPNRLILHGDPTQPGRDVSDQLPVGEFRPGRWAWLLDDIQPTTSRCPACWGLGYINARANHTDYGTGIEYDADACPCCADLPIEETGEYGVGHCDPIPTKGRQGLWTWEPESLIADEATAGKTTP